MTRTRPLRSLLPFIVTASLASLIAPVAHAQGDDDVEEQTRPIRAGNVAARARDMGYPADEVSFYQWVFNVRDVSELDDRLESALASHLEGVDRDCRLTEAQKKK